MRLPSWFFFVEIVAAIALPRWQRPVESNHGVRPSIAVLVPAHNESSGPSIDARGHQEPVVPGATGCWWSRIIAWTTRPAVAREAGAEVVERNDPENRGKGYALDWGIQHLGLDPPAIIIVVDADCRLAAGAIERLAATCSTTGRPVQALYLMTSPTDLQDQSSGRRILLASEELATTTWASRTWFTLPIDGHRHGISLGGDTFRRSWQRPDCRGFKTRLGFDPGRTSPLFCLSARVTSEFASSITGAVPSANAGSTATSK